MSTGISTVTASLIPVFLLIMLGYLLRRFNLPDNAFWPHLERFSYCVLFPVLIITSLSDSKQSYSEMLPMVTALWCLIGFTTATLAFALLVVRRDKRILASFVQGSIRFNSFVALAIAQATLGDIGISLGALAMGAMIPVVNLICVFFLVISVENQTPTWGRVFRSLATNPLLVSALIGLTMHSFDLRLPFPVNDSAAILSQATLPLGLLAVGAGIKLGDLRSSYISLGIGVVIRLILVPLIALALIRILSVPPIPATVVLIFGAVPTATSAYILARQMGGDHQLMANLISLQMILAVITIPLILGML